MNQSEKQIKIWKTKFTNFQKTSLFKKIVLISLFFGFVFTSTITYFIQSHNVQLPDKYYFFNWISVLITSIFIPLSGMGLQYTTKNDLSGPTTLGFLPITTTGAIIFLFVDKIIQKENMIFLQYLFSILISLIVFFLIYFISKKNPKNKQLVIVVGLLIGILFGSINSLIIFLFPQYIISYSALLGQTTIYYDWNRFYVSVPIMIVGALILLINGKKLNIYRNDENLATSLGINKTLLYWTSILGSTLISIGSTFLIGSILGLAIVIPYVAKKILNNSNFYLTYLLSFFITNIILMSANNFNSLYPIGLNTSCLPFVGILFIFMIWKGQKNEK